MATTDWSAHRKHPRREVDAEPVYLHVWQPGRGWGSVQGRVLDVSAGGVGLLVRDPLAKGTWLSIAVDAHEGNVRSGRHGRVASCGPADDGDLWRVGVSFRPTPPSTASHAAALGICLFTAAALWTNAPTLDNPAELACAGILSVLLAALAAAAHWQHRQIARRYERQRAVWARAWLKIEGPAETPLEVQAPAEYASAAASPARSLVSA